MSFATLMPTKEYLRSRTKDAIALSHEMQDAKGDLGYCIFVKPCEVHVKDKKFTFDTPEDAKAWVLRNFW